MNEEYKILLENYNLSTPLQIPILEFDKYWGSRSVFIKKNSYFFNLKFRILRRLLDAEIVTMNEVVESRSLIPHSQIATKDRPRDMKIYQFLNGAKIDEYDFSYTNDCVMIHFKGLKIHFTIVYKKNIIKYRDIIIRICDESRID